jgi:ribonuclease J
MIKPVEIIPLGGMGQFGMNCSLLKYGQDMIMIDCGMAFPRGYQRSIPGVSLMIPDLSALNKISGKIQGIIITHGHEDHIGALAYVLENINVPVYGSSLTLGLARTRLEERGLLSRVKLVEIKSGEKFTTGPFSIEPVGIDHSFPGSFSFAITLPTGTLIWTGDFKLGEKKPGSPASTEKVLSAYGDKGILALFSDSTNSCSAGFSPPEDSVREPLRNLFRKAEKKIIVSAFASSIKRIQFILDLADEFDRVVIPVGRSMIRNIGIAHQLNYLTIPQGILFPLKGAAAIEPERMVVLASGSQGEPLSALTRLSNEQVREIRIEKGDTVILSTKKIPGNENSINWVINQFYRHGAVVYDGENSRIHASGHAYSEELGRMIDLVRPRFFIPIHGDFRQLKTHASIAESRGIPEKNIAVIENGDHLSITRDGFEIVDRLDLNCRFIDEEFEDEVAEIILKERRHLSIRGLIVVIVRVDSMTGIMVGDPEFTFRGFIDQADYTDIASEAKKRIKGIVKKASLAEIRDIESFNETLRIETRRVFKKRSGKKPVVLPFTIEV